MLLLRFTTGFSALQRAENSSIVTRNDLDTFLRCFSALQRAENSSIDVLPKHCFVPLVFQCSSASRKFLNIRFQSVSTTTAQCFSALQRAENSSILGCIRSRSRSGDVFQCSSASRKFLNGAHADDGSPCARGFSALQRAENSSMVVRKNVTFGRDGVSVLFSEPKIPQYREHFPCRN